MGFANSWGKALPPTYRNVQAPVTDTLNDDEFNEFVAEQKKLQAEREANATENFVGCMEPIRETVPTEQVVEVAYQAFIQEDEKPKSKKKKKTEAVVEETPEVTEEVAEN